MFLEQFEAKITLPQTLVERQLKQEAIHARQAQSESPKIGREELDIKHRDDEKKPDLSEKKEFAPFKKLESPRDLIDEMRTRFDSTKDINIIKEITVYVKIQLLELCKSSAELNYYTARVDNQVIVKMHNLRSEKNLDTNDQKKLEKQYELALNKELKENYTQNVIDKRKEVEKKDESKESTRAGEESKSLVTKSISQAKESKPEKKKEFFGRVYGSLFCSGKTIKRADQLPSPSPNVSQHPKTGLSH